LSIANCARLVVGTTADAAREMAKTDGVKRRDDTTVSSFIMEQ
jgi:hypothetical protein